MTDTPFAFVPLRAGRSSDKPRSSGKTMVIDPGIPLGLQGDLLDMAGRYVDIAKIKTGNSRLFASDYLERKIGTYRDRGLEVFPGGQFLEYVLHALGESAVPAYWKEAARLGFTAIEVSDNVVEVDDELRRRLIGGARDAGLRVFGEVGSKDATTDPAILIRQAEVSFAAGADLVLVEAAEMIEDGTFNRRLFDAIAGQLDMETVVFELPGPWISKISHFMVEDMSKLLIRELGPDVNIGNVMFDRVMDLEAARSGLGVAGPPGVGVSG